MGLRDKAVSGVFWTGIGSLSSGFLNFVITIVLARLLSPSDFGLLELLAIFTVISECFIDSGFSQAVIRDNEASQLDLSSVFFFNLSISLFLYILLFFLSPCIASFYNEPCLTNLSRFVFLVIIFHSCSIIQNAIFTKNLQFRPLAITSITSVIISGTVTGILAYNGYGVWALATNIVLYAFLKMMFLWSLSKWRPIFMISRSSIRKYFRFGGNLLVQGLVDKFVTNFESLMIGKFYSKSDLGFFSQARKLDSYIIQTTSSVIQKVTYPILAKVESKPDSLKSGYRRIVGITMFVMTPILLFTVACSDNMLYVLFGEQWEHSIPFLRLWSLCGILQCYYSIFINTFLVTGNTRQLLYITLSKQLIRLIMIFSLIRISVMSIMFGIVGVGVFSAIIYCFYGSKLINYRLKEIWIDLRLTLLASIVSSLIVFLIGIMFSQYNHLFVFIVQICVMAGIYLTLSVHNKSFKETVSIVASLKHRLIK